MNTKLDVVLNQLKKYCINFRHPNGASFVRLEKVIPNSISFITAFQSKYGQDFDNNVHQEIIALMKQSKMSSFELVGMQKIQKKQA